MKKSILSVGCLLAALCSCSTPTPAPIPPIPGFFESISPSNGAMDVKQPVMLSWSYVGAGVIPAPTFDVLVWNNNMGDVSGTQLSLPQGPDGMLVRWQLIAHTQVGSVTGGVNEYTTGFTPAPAPTNTPPPPPPPVKTSGTFNASMFTDASDCPYSDTINAKVTSQDGWRTIHSVKPDEDPRRRYMLKSVNRVNSRYIVWFDDPSMDGNDVLKMALGDMQSPVDGHHLAPPEGWYEQCLSQGVNSMVVIWRDSPDSKVAITEQSVKNMIGSFKGSRWADLVFCLGLEVNRNTTDDQTVQAEQWFESNCTNKILICSQNIDYLLSLIPRCGPRAIFGLEQATHPTQEPLTTRWFKALFPGKRFARAAANPLTAGEPRATYKADLQRLITAVAHARNLTTADATRFVCASEWWITAQTDRIKFTRELQALGINLLCGDYSAAAAAPQSKLARHRLGWIKDAPGKHKRLYSARLHTAVFPPAFSLQPSCPPVYDQGQLGSCTANGFNAAYDMARYQLVGSFVGPARLKTYYDSRAMEGTVDQDAGAQIADVLTVLEKPAGGICPETMWPYDVSKFAQQPPPECYQYGQTNFVLQGQSVPQNLDMIKAVIYTEHAPVIIGMQVYEGDHGLESDACAKDGLCGMPSHFDLLQGSVGGHCVDVVGWDDARQIPLAKVGWLDRQRYSTGAFLVRNSWGTTWGLQGYFWLPYDYVLSPNLCGDFAAILSVGAAASLPSLPSSVSLPGTHP